MVCLGNGPRSFCHLLDCTCRLKKDAQLESSELSFTWGKMKTAAQEAASQIALRDCSKEAVRGMSIYTVLVKAEFNTIKHSFHKRFSASHEDLIPP